MGGRPELGCGALSVRLDTQDDEDIQISQKQTN